jgi:hypothetical protein
MNTTEKIQVVKSSLVRYARADRWNRNTEYNLGFNDDAQWLIEMVADGSFGFASDIASTVKKYNYSVSEKQAYWIAKTAVENFNDKLTAVIFN